MDLDSSRSSHQTTVNRPVYPTATPIRPEARRAFTEESSVEGGETGARLTEELPADENTLLLQQAANYASLATLINPVNTIEPSTERMQHQFHYDAEIDAVPKRRSSRGQNHRNHRFRDTPLTLYPQQQQQQQRDDVQVYDAPRLSISSAESSGGSEVKTPEPISGHPLWLHTSSSQESGDENRVITKQEQSSLDEQSNDKGAFHLDDEDNFVAPLSSPALVDFSSGLAEAGFPQAAMIARRQMNPQLVDSAFNLDQDVDKDDYSSAPIIDSALLQQQSRSSSGLTAQSKASTIRAKRPDALIRLPSARTDETARPSPPTSSSSVPSTGRPTPAATADNAFGKASDPMENAVLTSKGQGLLSSSFREESNRRSRESSAAAVGSGSEEDGSQDMSNSRNIIASPDSWRSLLPEHDPFFISSENLSSGHSSRAESFGGNSNVRNSFQGQYSSSAIGNSESSEGQMGNMTYNQALIASLGERDRRRLSSESSQSCFSLPGPTAVSNHTSSHASGSHASGSLYDMDGTFNSSGSRAAFAPLQYQYNHSSKSLASPLLHHGQENVESSSRGNSIDERQDRRISAVQQAAYRRHASFSTFDNKSSNLPSPLPQIHPDHQDRARVYGSRFQQPAMVASSSSSSERRASQAGLPGNKPHLFSAMTPSSPASSCAMGNEGDRESWPSSRNSLQGWQAETATAAIGPHSIQVLDPYSVDDKLSEGLQQTMLRSDYGQAEDATVLPGLLSTTSRTTEISAMKPSGLPLDQQLLTTTTTTTLTMTTTTLVTSPTSTHLSIDADPKMQQQQQSAASLTQHKGERQQQQQQQHTPNKTDVSYDVSPLSPPSLPFLDTRPAPASTDFHIETHSTHYILKTKLPGFSLDGITLATKHHRQLVIVADKWDESNGGHFERRVTFGEDANLRCTRANFDGTLLKITVPRHS